MTVQELFAYIDDVRPNAFTSEQKLIWLNELESRTQLEVMLRWPGEIVPYTWPEDQERELLLKPPHDAIYRYWLEAMIDFENGEYSRYQNSMEMFNARWLDFVAWFAETYRPDRGDDRWEEAGVHQG